MKTELILFKFYEAEKGEFLFQVVNKKIPDMEEQEVF